MENVALVIEHAEVCADASQVEVAVRGGLPPAFVARGAQLRVQLARGTRGTEAHATLVLADGAVESRAFNTSSRACASLVRALGAWVSVRMDEWTERNAADTLRDPRRGAPAPAKSATEQRGDEEREAAARSLAALPPTSGLDAAFDVDREGRRVPEPSGPELSAGSSLIGGLARTTLGGATASVTFGLTDAIGVRTGLFGYLGAVTAESAYGHRVEVCRRVPGGYARFNGLALDLCGGGDVGILERHPFAAFGPSLVLHGDLARSLSLDLGGGISKPFGKSVANEPSMAVAMRWDLGLSWRLP